MRTRRIVIHLAGLAIFGALVVGGGIFARSWVVGDGPEYADPPFPKVDASYPRVIRVADDISPEEYLAANVTRFRGGALERASAAEREAVKLVYSKKYVQGREAAETILRSRPDSIPAQYARAVAVFEGDCNLPAAIHHIRQLRKQLEQRGRENPQDRDALEWYLRVMDKEYAILRDLDRPEEQLLLVATLEKVYQPLPAYRVWPLFKLKRLDDAERAIEEMEKTGRWEHTAFHDRSVLAEQRGDREGCYQLGKQVADKTPGAVQWFNFALGAKYTFRLDEAEKAFLRAAQMGRPNFHGTAYRQLAMMYLQQGRVLETFKALQQAEKQRAQRPRHWLQYDQAGMQRAVSLLLLVAGDAERAERYALKASNRPDRTGGTTNDETDIALLNGLVRWMALTARVEELREQEAARTGLGSLAPDADRKGVEVQAWTVERALRKIAHDPKRRSSLRPYMPGNCDELDPWFTASLVRILPPGVAAESIREFREQEKHAGALPYLDGLDAEVALLRGRPEEALALARKALEKLSPATERLFCGRVAAVAAEAAWRLGRPEEALPFSRQVLRDAPLTLRLLSLGVPVHVEDDGSPLARRVGGALLSSPRFVRHEGGLRLVVRASEGRLTVELYREGEQKHCELSLAVEGEEAAFVARALREFHGKMMSPMLDLSTLNINSLEGATGAIRAREAFDQILGDRGGRRGFNP